MLPQLEKYTRPYQKHAINTITDTAMVDTRALLVAPTGAGKTRMFCLLILDLLVSKCYDKDGGIHTPITFLIIVDRVTINEQNKKTFLDMLNMLVDDGLILEEHIPQFLQRVDFFVINTIYNLMQTNKTRNRYKYDVVIIDEVHDADLTYHLKNTMYYKTISLAGRSPKDLVVIGCTATPYNLKLGYIFGDNKPFKKIDYKIKLSELVDEGYLARPIIFNNTNTKIKEMLNYYRQIHENKGNDLTEKELKLITQTNEFFDIIFEAIDKTKEKNFRHVVIFVSSISVGDTVTNRLKEKGLSAMNISSENTDKEQDEILNAFTIGTVNYLCCCDMLIKGWDNHKVDCIIFARPTLSPAIYIQAIGRGLRKSDDTKKECYVYDLVDMFTDIGSDLDNPIVKDKPYDTKYTICRELAKKLEEHKEVLVSEDIDDIKHVSELYLAVSYNDVVSQELVSMVSKYDKEFTKRHELNVFYGNITINVILETVIQEFINDIRKYVSNYSRGEINVDYKEFTPEDFIKLLPKLTLDLQQQEFTKRNSDDDNDKIFLNVENFSLTADEYNYIQRKDGYDTLLCITISLYGRVVGNKVSNRNRTFKFVFTFPQNPKFFLQTCSKLMQMLRLLNARNLDKFKNDFDRFKLEYKDKPGQFAMKIYELFVLHVENNESINEDGEIINSLKSEPIVIVPIKEKNQYERNEYAIDFIETEYVRSFEMTEERYKEERQKQLEDDALPF